MYRYEIILYSKQEPIITVGLTNNNLIGNSWYKKYIQFLGGTDGTYSYSFWEMEDLNLKGKYPILITRNGTTRILKTKIKEVRKVKI